MPCCNTEKALTAAGYGIPPTRRRPGNLWIWRRTARAIRPISGQVIFPAKMAGSMCTTILRQKPTAAKEPVSGRCPHQRDGGNFMWNRRLCPPTHRSALNSSQYSLIPPLRSLACRYTVTGPFREQLRCTIPWARPYIKYLTVKYLPALRAIISMPRGSSPAPTLSNCVPAAGYRRNGLLSGST